MTNAADKISVPPLLFVENKDIMVNMENYQAVVLKLLEAIRELEARVEELES